MPGRDTTEKADKLVKKLRQQFNDDNVRILHPTRTEDILITNFDDSVMQYEVKLTISERRECPFSNMRIGLIRFMRNGLYSIWARCSLAAAIRVAEAGKINQGWTTVRVLLEERMLHYYRCMALGHTRERCPSMIDRSGCCFNCGSDAHKRRECKSKLFCPV